MAKKYQVNPAYQAQAETVKEQLDQEGRVVLQDFFTKEIHTDFSKLVHRLNYRKAIQPDKYDFRRAGIPKRMLAFLHSEAFLEWLSEVLGEPIAQLGSGGSYRFGWKNYTLLHDEMLLSAGIDLIFDFTEDFPSEVGGEIVYTIPGEESFTTPIKANTLTIVKRPDEMQRFIHYVNHHAGEKKRYFVLVSV